MTEDIGGYRMRYCHDVSSPGKVRVYVEGRPAGSRPDHLIHSRKSPPYICIKGNAKPSSGSEARQMARRWVRDNG